MASLHDMTPGRRRVAIGVSALLFLGACSGNGDTRVARPVPGDDPQSTTTIPGVDDPDGRFVGLRSSAPTLLRSQQTCDEVLQGIQSIAATAYQGAREFAAMGGTLDGFGSVADGAAQTESAAAPTANRQADEDAAGTSTTNTQEAGIDEPDTVETNGDHVFVVAGNMLTILDGATAQVVSRTELAAGGAQLLLSGDRLLVLSSPYGGGQLIDDVFMAGEEAIERSGRPYFAGPQTTLELFDVADVAAPRLVQRSEVDGGHVTTRVVDGVARVVITSYPQPVGIAEAIGSSYEEGGTVDLDGEIRNAIAATTVADWLPQYAITDFGGGNDERTRSGVAVGCADVFVPEVDAGLAETSILRVDFESGFDPAATTTVVAEAGTVYASGTSLYLAATAVVAPEAQGDIAAQDWSTAIHAFDLTGPGAATHLAAGSVPGSTLNQYSLSEYEGALRVATTTGTPWGSGRDSESGVHVLRRDGAELREIGAVTGLGKTETIQSVRFMGPTGYVVTFRQTDPLYVIDLSDPAAPVAVGELKIPGFSSYLHPAGEGRLIGIGRDADDEGRDQGFALSLFDVSDPTQPRQIQRFTATDTYSAAEHDPHAFLWWDATDNVVVPLETYTPTGTGRVGMSVFDVSDTGITPRGLVQVDNQYPSRALVVQGSLWSLFDSGVAVSSFDAVEDASFTPYR